MDKKIIVGKIYGQDIILYTLSGVFTVTVGGVEFNDMTLPGIVRQVEISDIVVMDEKVLYKDSVGCVKHRIIKRLDAEGTYFYDENNNQKSLVDAYPNTTKNRETFDKMKHVNDEGWAIIRKSERMVKELESYPKDHFKKILQKALDEKIKKIKERRTD